MRVKPVYPQLSSGDILMSILTEFQCDNKLEITKIKQKILPSLYSYCIMNWIFKAHYFKQVFHVVLHNFGVFLSIQPFGKDSFPWET